MHPHNSYSVSVSAVTVREGPYTQVMEVTTLEDSEYVKTHDIGSLFLGEVEHFLGEVGS